jgi:SsrA-binding protein
MKPEKNDNTIVINKKIFFEYLVEEEFIAGIALEGWEVKSLREGKINITDSHVIIKRGEAFLLGAQIQPLATAAKISFPDPVRTRKLLLTRREINRLIGAVERSGYTIIPISLFWQKNHIKIKIALAKGKKQHDKRESVKDRDWQRQQARILKR